MNKWNVKVTFAMNDNPHVEFIVDDFDSVLSVLRIIKFRLEVFKIEIWQNRELTNQYNPQLRNLGPIQNPETSSKI